MSQTMTAQKSLYLIDAHAYLHRAYHALPPLTNSAGLPVGAVYGFTRMLMALLKREKPDLLAVCFDAPGPTFRHKAFKDYKATRKPLDEDLKTQLALSRELVAAMGLKAVEIQGYEADDLMATLARKGVNEDLHVVLVSGDKDALQLVGEGVTVLNESSGVRFNAAKVEEKFKVTPAQLVDYLALIGDVSDNVPGVPGIGAVGAVKLLKRFGTLERILSAARKGHPDLPEKTARALAQTEKEARLSQELIRLDEAAPVQLEPSECRVPAAFGEALRGLFRHLEFHSLLREIGGDGEVPTSVAVHGPEPRELACEAFLEAAKGAQQISLAAAAVVVDLTQDSSWLVALGLADGRVTVMSDPDIPRNRAALKRILTSNRTLKVGHDLKSAILLLRNLELDVSLPLFDTWLAAYCLNPSGTRPEPEAGQGPRESLLRQASGQVALGERLASELKAMGLDKLYYELEVPLIRVLADMEAAGVALNAAYLRELGGEFASRIQDLKREMDALAGSEVNPNSPKQIAKLLFDDLKLQVVHKTEKGGRSTDEDTLVALAGLHPLPAKLIDYRELTKLKSTYIDGLLERMNPKTERVHTHFQQALTATGRLSSQDPNLQNIPIRTPLGQKIRQAFVAGKGKVLLSADYSQIELRILAHLSEDPVLREAFERGEDIHLKTASEVFGVPLGKVDKEMRRRAKAVNFGIVYGQTAHGLSQELKIPFAEARDIIRRYFERYRGVSEWIQKNLETARREGAVRTLKGRLRYLPELSAKNFAVRSFGERAAVNTPIQGSSADIIKAAMIRVHAGLVSKGKARLVLQVHDELLFELPKAEARSFAPWVRRQMEEAAALNVPVVVDLKSGPNWQDMEAL